MTTAVQSIGTLKTTDENGVAIIRCNNANSSTFLTISCEALYNGQPAAINVHSIKY